MLATTSPALRARYALAAAVAASIEAAALGEAAVAIARIDYPHRQAADEAAARLSAQAEQSLPRIARYVGEAAYLVVSKAVGEALGQLARASLDLKPLVLIETQVSMPSTALAWALYGDPSRAPELVARAKTGTPLFMPASFEAIAP